MDPKYIHSEFILLHFPLLYLTMPSFSRIALSAAYAGTFLSQIVAAGHSEYCLDFPLSCTNTSVVPNTCCFNYPGGELLQTQFWDTDPATGPANHWTIHGLWYVLPLLHVHHLVLNAKVNPHFSSPGLTTAMAPTANTATKAVNTRTSALF